MAEKFTAFDPEIFNRAEAAIAHGALTNSKRPAMLVKGVYPTHLSRGKDSFVWDTKGNRYLDFICGLGANLLGYGNETVNAAIFEQAKKGATLSLGTEMEVKTAERVKEIFPWIDRVRFLKTGSDACSASLRIARTFHQGKRTRVYSEGYHGTHDEFVSLTPPALGIPKTLTQHILKLEKEYDASELAHAAGVIIEPVMTDASEERKAWVQKLREDCTKAGTLLIFDEIITGFRWPKLSVSNAWGIEPDLICLGKAIANGMPVSVVGGKQAIMECDEYFISSTFAGETLSLSAAYTTMGLLQTKFHLAYLWEQGELFRRKFNQLWPEGVTLEGYATRGVFKGALETKALFWQEACKAGLLFGPSFFFNFGHIEHVESVIQSCKDILTRVQMGAVKLEGDMPRTPFAQSMREGKAT